MIKRASLTLLCTATVAVTGCQSEGSVSEDLSAEVVPTYEEATTEEAALGRSLLEQNAVLESLAAETPSLVSLPDYIDLVGAECGEPNAFWDHETRTITLCYEEVSEVRGMFESAGYDDLDNMALSDAVGTYYHELGHALVSMLELPITGQEEDAVDQFSAIVLLNNPEAEFRGMDYPQIAYHVAQSWLLLSEYEEIDDVAFAGEHPLSIQRAYNQLCWVYGSDPNRFAHIAESGDLPQERAENCEYEYAQIKASWTGLLESPLRISH